MIKIKQDQVGPGKFTPGATPAPTPTPTAKLNSNTLFDKINKSLADKGVKPVTGDDQETGSFIDSIMQDEAQAVVIGKILKARGKNTGASVQAIKNLFVSEAELAAIASQSKGDYNKLITLLNEDYIPELGKKEAAKGFDGPSRSIYKYTDDDLNLIIKNVYQEKAMRLPTEEELAAERSKIRPSLETGTVSTTKLARNAKGVMEQVTTQQGGPTQESVAMSIEDRLKAANPDDVDRTARINFSSWLSQSVGGQ
jgi:hypothetical protein